MVKVYFQFYNLCVDIFVYYLDICCFCYLLTEINLNKPILQGVQLVSPAEENDPSSQRVQLNCADNGWIVPAGQGSQSRRPLRG